MIRSALTLTVLLANSATVAAGQLPDGTYGCSISGMLSGDFEIVGNTYKGPAFDGNYEGTYAYELSDAGTITWAGPVGAYTADGYAIVSTTTYGSSEIEGFDLLIDPPDSDNYSTVSCDRE